MFCNRFGVKAGQAQSLSQVGKGPFPKMPAPNAGKCLDTFATCPGWQGQCAVPGVSFHCPCTCGGAAQQAGGRRLVSAAPTQAAQPSEISDKLEGAVDVAVCLAKSVGADAGVADAVGKAAKIAFTVKNAAEDIRDVVQPTQPLAAGRALKQTIRVGLAPACVDSFPACPGWQGQCAVPGVSFHCPCMCGTAPAGRRLAGAHSTQAAQSPELSDKLQGAVDVAVGFAKSVGADAGIADVVGKAAKIAITASGLARAQLKT